MLRAREGCRSQQQLGWGVSQQQASAEAHGLTPTASAAVGGAPACVDLTSRPWPFPSAQDHDPRRRPHHHRSGLRVRLLRDPGVQGTQVRPAGEHTRGGPESRAAGRVSQRHRAACSCWGTHHLSLSDCLAALPAPWRRSEGYEVILVNSNPATIMTDPGTADRTCVGCCRVLAGPVCAAAAMLWLCTGLVRLCLIMNACPSNAVCNALARCAGMWAP